MNNNFILSLNGLRFYLFLLILATHYKYIINISPIGQNLYPFLDQGQFAVLFFFILSGFCIALGYSEKFDIINKTTYFSFIKKRIKKIYPLYIITGLIMLMIYYLPHNVNWLYAFIFLYIPMLAPYSPFPDGGGNGAGWFISALFLCYLITPFIIKFLKRQNLLLYLFILYICIVCIALIPLAIPFLRHNASFLYKFPLIRIFHYGFGLVLGMIYATNQYKLQKIKIIQNHSLLFECFVIFSTLIIMFGFKHGDVSNPILGTPIISIIILYLCNIKNGLLYKLFTNKVSQYLGNISFECYLIHYPLCILLSDKIKPYCSSLGNICIFYLLLLILTIILSLLYKYISIKLKI